MPIALADQGPIPCYKKHQKRNRKNNSNAFNQFGAVKCLTKEVKCSPLLLNLNKTVISALGLDIGQKRIGIAGCDGLGLIAIGLGTITRSSFVNDLAQFRQIVEERSVQVLVSGLPYNMNGTLGFQARQVQKYATRVASALNLPLEYMDERLTSYQAEQLLLAENISPSRNKGLIDRKAAALILQQWLDQRREQLSEGNLE
jgi:putative Holliday junction resolvase